MFREGNKLIQKYLTTVKDIVFPMYCLGCNVEGSFVCEQCFKTLDLSGVFCCPVCHAKQPDGVCCEACRPQSSLDLHIAITPYQEHSLKGNIIHTLKYSYAQDILGTCEKIFLHFLSRYKLEADFLIPIPLHKRRYAERGFNQAELLAQIISNIMHIPLLKPLKRSRHTKQQAKLNRGGRLTNLANAFEIEETQKDMIKNKTIIIVDDVFTTGSTMQECAKVLKENNATQTIGFTIARG
ncbi:MAG: ComF family protein [Candidatus Magasanikbacteria bacterium]